MFAPHLFKIHPFAKHQLYTFKLLKQCFDSQIVGVENMLLERIVGQGLSNLSQTTFAYEHFILGILTNKTFFSPRTEPL